MAVESYVRLGMDLLSATAKVDESLGFTTEQPVVPVPAAVDNAKTLAEMEQMMKRLR